MTLRHFLDSSPDPPPEKHAHTGAHAASMVEKFIYYESASVLTISFPIPSVRYMCERMSAYASVRAYVTEFKRMIKGLGLMKVLRGD